MILRRLIGTVVQAYRVQECDVFFFFLQYWDWTQFPERTTEPHLWLGCVIKKNR